MRTFKAVVVYVLVALVATILAAVPAVGYGQGRRGAQEGGAPRIYRLPTALPSAGTLDGGTAPSQPVVQGGSGGGVAVPDLRPLVPTTMSEDVVTACFRECFQRTPAARIAVCGRSDGGTDVPVNAAACIGDASIPACVQAGNAIRAGTAVLTAVQCRAQVLGASPGGADQVAAAAARRAATEQRRQAAARECQTETTSAIHNRLCRACYMAGGGRVWVVGDRGLEIVRRLTGSEAVDELAPNPMTGQPLAALRCETQVTNALLGTMQRENAATLRAAREYTEGEIARVRLMSPPVGTDAATVFALLGQAVRQMMVLRSLDTIRDQLIRCRDRYEPLRENSDAAIVSPVANPRSMLTWLNVGDQPASVQNGAEPNSHPFPRECESIVVQYQDRTMMMNREFGEGVAAPLSQIDELVDRLDQVTTSCQGDASSSQACLVARQRLTQMLSAFHLAARETIDIPPSRLPAPPAREPITPTNDPPR